MRRHHQQREKGYSERPLEGLAKADQAVQADLFRRPGAQRLGGKKSGRYLGHIWGELADRKWLTGGNPYKMKGPLQALLKL